MPEIATSETLSIDDVLRSTMIHAWDDFSAAAAPHAIRVEYLGQPGVPFDELTIWLVSAGGYQERICDYRIGPSLHHSIEWRCWTRIHSARLVGALDFIMRHQERFRRTAGANLHGVIVVFPPTQEDRAEAAAWMARIGVAVSPPAVARARAAAVGRPG